MKKIQDGGRKNSLKSFLRNIQKNRGNIFFHFLKKMDCPHEKLEEMYGINFCVECGEEISTTIGEIKGGSWKHGHSPKEKMTQDDKLQKDMFRYKFPYGVTLKAIKLYRHYLTVTGRPIKGKVRKTIAFGCWYVAFMVISGTVGMGNILKVIGIKEKSGQRGLAQVTATLDGADKLLIQSL